MRDRPADDRKVTRPGTSRASTPEALMEPPETVTEPIAISSYDPTRSLLLKGLPILVARVAVTELGRIHYPWKRMVPGGGRSSHVLADLLGDLLQLQWVEAVFKRKDRLVTDGRGAASPKVLEMRMEVFLPVRERHGRQSAALKIALREQDPDDRGKTQEGATRRCARFLPV